MRHLKIVIIEDSPFDADLIERELLKAGISFTTRLVDTKAEFQKCLSTFQPDIILSDHSMPRFNSIEAFRYLQEFQKDSDTVIPFILVTGEVSEEFAVQCIKAGVDDYILKDRLKRLPLSIESALEKSRIEGERKKYLREIILKEGLMTEAGHLAQLGSWQADLVTGKHTWSDETFCLYGYTKGEIEPGLEAFFALVHPDDLEFLGRYHEEALKNSNDGEMEFRIIDKTGKLKYISCKLHIHRDAQGRPQRITGFNLDITERKKTELRLKKSTQEYKSLFDQNPDAVFSMDVAGAFTNVNQAVLELTGLSREELFGRNFRSLADPDDRDRITGHFHSALERRPQRFEAKFIDCHGQPHVLDVTYMPVVANDAIIGVHGLAKDITARKDLENRLDQAYRFARIGGWESNLIAKKISWTAITREIHEVAPDFEPDMQTSVQFYKEGKNHDIIRNAVEKCVQSGTPYDLELKIITGKGNERWVRATGEAERKNGVTLRLFGTFQDIDDRKRAEETLNEAYREKINILESIGDGFFAVDKNWMVTYWNNIAQKMLGKAREDIIGKKLWDVYPNAVSGAFYDEYQKAMEGNSPNHFEEFYAPLKIWLEVNVYPSATGLSIYFKNITEQKKHIRKIKIQNEQLKEIAYIQSHEVRAPLARIMGLVALLQEEGPDAQKEMHRVLTDIANSAKELDGLIRKIVKKTEQVGYKE